MSHAAATAEANVITIFDADKATRFEDRMVDNLNAGALCLMTSIGHRTGLFDALDGLRPATSSEIAATAGLNERYVREWLGAMVTSQVIEHDHEAATYRLPPEHAAILTRDSAPDNLAVFTQYIPLLGTVEDDIVECFRHGGGVPYEKYGRFHEVMAEDSGQTVLPALENHILPLAPGLVKRLENGIDVLDVGCGRGKAMLLMAQLYPKSRFTGIDLSEEAITYAREQVKKQGLTNIDFKARDLTSFDRETGSGTFDLIFSFDAIHDQADPLAVVKGIRQALNENGIYLAQDIKGSGHHHHDIDHPIGPLLYTISCMHCMTVSLAQNGAGLGAMWGKETALGLFEDAGFETAEVHELDHDIQNYYYICRP